MKYQKQLLGLNLGLLFMSTSGIFGRLIETNPELTILFRCIIASIILYIFIRIMRLDFSAIINTDRKFIILGGALLTIHWVTYFYSLSIHSIAIAILTLHSFPAMTAILEPLILKSKFKVYHLALAILILSGLWIILPSIDVKNNIVLASLLGIISALAYALRNIWTRKIMVRYNGSVMMFYQLVVASILLTPYLFIHDTNLSNSDWSFIFSLAILTTVIGHTLVVKSFKYFSAITVSLISSVVPIYSILWGVLLLREIPDTNTLLGGSLIFLSFLVETYFSQKK